MSSSLSTVAVPEARSILAGSAEGKAISTTEALSFWGGVDPATGRVIDVHHPLHGTCLTGGVLFMPTSRGSCTGSGVLLDLILTGRAPSALVFCEAEDVLTLGALIAAEMFGKPLPVLRLDAENFARFSKAVHVRIDETAIEADGVSLAITPPATAHLDLGDDDRAMLEGRDGVAVQQAMRITVAMAAQQGASALVDVTQGHIDGCIYASPANLTFAEKMAEMGAKVRVPTTMNAISVDKAHWRSQGMPEDFGDPAARLADAYVRMGCRPTFTCSPYLLDSAPQAGDMIAWAESNAVIFANTVLGARTAKHPDFLDLCIALTGRAPLAGVYLEENRRPQRIVNVALPQGVDDAFWPLIGYLAGKAAPDCIPLLRGLGPAKPSRDDLKALCAAFGTTSAAPMLHIEGVTPEAGLSPLETADTVTVSPSDMAAGWSLLNEGPEEVQLVAIGSPHASLEECQALAAEFAGRRRHADVAVIVTAGQQVIDAAGQDGTLQSLRDSGVQVLPDLCWCSISEPVFPTKTRALMTNSGKYAHYGPGLSGRAVRFGSLAECVESALTGRAPSLLPSWLS
ncbi:cis-3-hydroxy-L-proline dehydratase [Agrobacterium sp. LMR679]|uniref:cis-3-hydroxy-L-proline dehydratase n=1 Tax=Agrobacterium sp. LMR679 TaxID=3014335 RepID=UPI0022AF523A|nr:aconitase X [Agrobacterium sp. LMR679]MCZ4073451.1 aconitase X [Agrobacterium sp. LMR679]